ncbi:MAG TPA: YdeI/OmpD-associated family protein [Flavitalea sp.]|nr:YdeI/OmpD-associated family protein [Flavitalea sp.]
MEKPLINKKYKLEKFPGKGGWTYTVISEIPPDKRARFGWVKVKGLIDDFELKGYHLMPMANGKLFLPVRAEIRKKIKKQAGDWVKVILFQDTEPLFIPDEFLQCLRDEPAAYKTFHSYSESSKKYYVDWIYSAKKVETRVERMAQAIDRLARGLKPNEPMEK